MLRLTEGAGIKAAGTGFLAVGTFLCRAVPHMEILVIHPESYQSLSVFIFVQIILEEKSNISSLNAKNMAFLGGGEKKPLSISQ